METVSSPGSSPGPAPPQAAVPLTGPLAAYPGFRHSPSLWTACLENSLQEPGGRLIADLLSHQGAAFASWECTHNAEGGARCIRSGPTGLWKRVPGRGVAGGQLDPTPASTQHGSEVPPQAASLVHLPQESPENALSWGLCLQRRVPRKSPRERRSCGFSTLYPLGQWVNWPDLLNSIFSSGS